MKKNMISKMRELNESLPEIFLIDIIYLILGILLVLLFVPEKGQAVVGIFAGVVYSMFASIHLSFRIRKVVYGHASATKTFVGGYFIRLLVMFVIFAALYIFHMGDLLCALIGMFSMKVSAYLQPATHRFLTKISKKGR